MDLAKTLPTPSYGTANKIGTFEDHHLHIRTYLEYSEVAKKHSKWLKCEHTLRFKKKSHIGRSQYTPYPLMFIGKHFDNFSDWLYPILETKPRLGLCPWAQKLIKEYLDTVFTHFWALLRLMGYCLVNPFLKMINSISPWMFSYSIWGG